MNKITFTLLAISLSPIAFAMEDHAGHIMNHSMPSMAQPMPAMSMPDLLEPAPLPSLTMTPEVMPVGPEMPNMDMMHHQNEAGTMTPSDQAYTHINHTMHEGMNIEFTGNPDIDFLRGMIPHHQGAVDMAQVQLDYGTDGSLKSFTKRVIREQAREIRFMNINLQTLEFENKAFEPNQEAIAAFKAVNMAMHADMNMALSGQADTDFVKGMIPHHQGAVAMAKVVLEYGSDSNAKRLAYDIIMAQESEIAWMNHWLARQRFMKTQ